MHFLSLSLTSSFNCTHFVFSSFSLSDMYPLIYPFTHSLTHNTMTAHSFLVTPNTQLSTYPLIHFIHST